ncbi:MAG: L,D-transpeptidase [Candidatus Latescibacterota bacterium]|nr:MAG: L,D-transpeptidase [Candidatus Latescibacterota bacterium]
MLLPALRNVLPFGACALAALVPVALALFAPSRVEPSAVPVAALEPRLEASRTAPADIVGPALVIDVDACRFELYDADQRLLRSGPCSTGSNTTLQAPDGRRWSFRTPRGRRRVHHKAERPTWYRPDWSFVEEGLPIPQRDDPARWVQGLLGRYAIDIGGGYLVHGSPWRIGVGEKNTHGCVRLRDDDLACVYAALQVGDVVILR